MIKPRQEIFDTYWEFAAERQRVFYRRLHGYPSPWTEDKILLAYRFCNAFRAADRTAGVGSIPSSESLAPAAWKTSRVVRAARQ